MSVKKSERRRAVELKEVSPPVGTRVAVACSGGVDSSFALMQLQRDGMDVEAFTLRVIDSTKNEYAVVDAAEVARKLEVPHHVIDIRDRFRQLVIADFAEEYARGRTPNPCVRCNERVKFGLLRGIARELGCDYLATGHYARILHDGTSWGLYRGTDDTKDQAYALYRLKTDQLPFTLFPAGLLSKWAVRQLAVTSGLVTAQKEESQDICFIDGDYARFLAELGFASPPGDIVDTAGRLLGRHKGLHSYTVGQRRNLGLPGGTDPYYVIELRPADNTLLVGNKADLLSRSFTVSDCNWLIEPPLHEPMHCGIRIRYHSAIQLGRVHAGPEGLASVVLGLPFEAITPGQSAVFYDGDRVLGGGVIEKVERQSAV